jgi:hypothetical protein
MSELLAAKREMSEPPAVMPGGPRSMVLPTSLPPTVASTVRSVSSPDEVEALPPGALFRTPDGKTLTRPYDVTDDAGYRNVPEGQPYREGGKTRLKPKGEALDPRAQALYDMAHTDEGRKAALAYIYGPDRVKEERGEFYVEGEGGTRRSPSSRAPAGLGSRALGAVAGSALPTAGSVAGSIGGAALGNLPGGVAGAAAGGAAGEGANQAILRALGVEKLGWKDAALAMGTEGAVSAAGQGLASVVPAIPAALKTAAGYVGQAGPKIAQKFLGVVPEKGAAARELAAEGARMTPEAYTQGSPFLNMLVDWGKQFGYNPLADGSQSRFSKMFGSAPGNVDWLGKRVEPLLEGVGATPAERQVVRQTAAPSSAPAGEAALAKIRADTAAAETALRARVDAFRATEEGAAVLERDAGLAAIEAERKALTDTMTSSRATVKRTIDAEIAGLERDAAVDLARAGANPGDVARQWGQTIWDRRREMGQNFKTLYDGAGALAGKEAPDVAPLRPFANMLMDDLNPIVRELYPREHTLLAKLAGRPEVINPADVGPISFADLHELRTLLRSKVNWDDLTSGPGQGILKRLQGEVDGVINNMDASPALKAAAGELKRVDSLYGQSIARFEDQTVRQVATFARAGAPVNADSLAALVFKPGNTERIRMIKEIGGPDLVRTLEGAELKRMLNEAGAGGGVIDEKEFAKQVVERIRSGVFREVYGEARAHRLELAADRILKANGQSPLRPRPGDTVFDLVERAEAAQTAVAKLSPKETLAVFDERMASFKDAVKAMQSEGDALINTNPLAALRNSGAEAVAYKILNNSDLLAAAAKQFGTDSAEMQALRVLHSRQMFQDLADKVVPAFGTGGGAESVEKMVKTLTPETQAILFPGLTRGQVIKFVNDVQMIFPAEMSNFGTSLSGANAIINPQSVKWLTPVGGAILKAVPIPLARAIISNALDIISDALTHPATVKWITTGLDSASRAEREAAAQALRQMFRSAMETAAQRGPYGAGIGGMGGSIGGAGDVPPGEEEAPLPEPPQGGYGLPAWRQAPSYGTPPWRQ